MAVATPSRTADGAALVRRLITPEGVDLRLRLASVAERAAAFLLDLLIIAAALVGLTILAFAAGATAGKQNGEVVTMTWLLGAFLLRNGYFILFELSGAGRHPGQTRARPAGRRP